MCFNLTSTKQQCKLVGRKTGALMLEKNDGAIYKGGHITGLLFETWLHHLPQNAHQVLVLKGCCNTLLVRQLLIDFL